MKKMIIIVAILVVAVLLIPIPYKAKDGGTVLYNAIIYDVYDMHSIRSEGEEYGYIDGVVIEIFGIEVFNNTRFVADGEATDTNSPYFCGRIVEVNSKGFLVEVTDGGNGAFAESERVQVNTELAGSSAYGVGDYLKIIFDGKVAMSYPPQVTSVHSIIRIDGE